MCKNYADRFCILHREKHIKSMANALEKVRFDNMHFFFLISRRIKLFDSCNIYFTLIELPNSVLPGLMTALFCIHCFRD